MNPTPVHAPTLDPISTLLPGPAAPAAESFAALGLSDALQRNLREEGYTAPTPIQRQAIPDLLAGRDLLGCAQTGTGKTAAFALPILQRLAADPRRAPARGARVLVLTPTRELAQQVADSFRTYGRHLPISGTVVFGGVGARPQIDALARGVDVLVATPGRLLDLMGQGHARLGGVEVLVLDEADRMLDMGFLPDVQRIIAALPAQRQTLLLSATVPPPIADLSRRLLRNPVTVSVAPSATTVEGVRQHVLFVERGDKARLLGEMLRDPAMTRVLVFTRTKHGANRLGKDLEARGVHVDAIHGNKSQNARQGALFRFSTGKTRVLVATDIAARGLDIEDVTHVVNYDLPNEPENYVHRIGRTARAGASGVALSLCDGEERAYLRDIERLTRLPIAVVEDHPYKSQSPAPPSGPRPSPRGGFQHGHRGRYRR